MTARPLRVLSPAPGVAKTNRIPVARPSLPRADAIGPYLERIDETRHYSNFGPLVRELEGRLSARGEGAPVTTITNATQGLSLLLRAVTKGEGLCLMPGFTFVATAHAAAQAGLKPYFADVNAQSWMLTPTHVRAALRAAPERVAAIIVVAAFGALPDLHGFAELQRETGVPVILDAAAAFDALRRPTLASVVSLHATKVLGVGEGGYVTAEDAALIERVAALSGFGFQGSRQARALGTNAKMSEYTAAVALAALDTWDVTLMRWMIAARKLRLAAFRAPSIKFQRGWGESWISSTCMVETLPGAGPALAAHLAAHDIASCAWWGAGLHTEPAFAGYPREALPNVDRLAASTLGIPFAIDMSDDDFRRLGQALVAFSAS